MKKLITKISLMVEFTSVDESKPIIEQRIHYESVKETSGRTYLHEVKPENRSSLRYVKKDMMNIIQGECYCVRKNKTGDDYKFVYNTTVFCPTEEVDEYSKKIREDLSRQVLLIENKIKVFQRLYAHEDIIEKESAYVTISE
jgi:hypothetical protein